MGLGSAEKIPDGLSYITVHITFAGFPDYTNDIYFYPTCQLACCIKRMALALKPDMDCCKDEALKKFLKAKAYYDSMEWAKECCNFDAVDKDYKMLKKLCSESGYSNC
jgi:hypothetical protein